MDAKTLCLGILFRGDATGYEIRKECMEGPFASFQTTGYGSIYPALTALEQAGHATCRAEVQNGRPDKKVYSITSAGRFALLEAIMSEPGPDKIRSDFVFAAFFGEMLPASQLDSLFDSRMTWLEQQLDEMARREPPTDQPGAKFAWGLGRAIFVAQMEYLRDHRHELLAASLNAEGVRPEAAE